MIKIHVLNKRFIAIIYDISNPIVNRDVSFEIKIRNAYLEMMQYYFIGCECDIHHAVAVDNKKWKVNNVHISEYNPEMQHGMDYVKN